MTSDDVEKCIDALDGLEPIQAGWRVPFDRLETALRKARRVRSRVRNPIITLAIAIYFLHAVFNWLNPDWQVQAKYQWLDYVVLALVTSIVIWDFNVEKLFPVLKHEDRVAALLRYFGARDMPDEVVL